MAQKGAKAPFRSASRAAKGPQVPPITLLQARVNAHERGELFISHQAVRQLRSPRRLITRGSGGLEERVSGWPGIGSSLLSPATASRRGGHPAEP
jgi:hypothetical protein